MPRDPEAGSLQRFDARAVVMEKELATVEQRLWREFPRYMELTQPKPVTVEELQKRLLRPGEALLTYALLNKRTAIFAVTPTGFRLVLVPTPRADVAKLIQSVRRPEERMAAAGSLAVLTELNPRRCIRSTARSWHRPKTCCKACAG